MLPLLPNLPSLSFIPAALLLLACAALLPGCGRSEQASASAASGASGASAAAGPGGSASAPPIGVTTVRAVQRDLPVLIATTGIVTPLASVDVRAQSTSPVLKVHVKEGQFVRAGELLFTLDARAAEADAAKARAQLARDQATLADAQRLLARSRELVAQNFISQGAVDTNQAQVDAQRALVAADQAAVDAARLTLSYARITAPAAGRLGAINVFPGTLVQANSTPLVSVTQLDPITVAFSLPQRHLADALAALKDGGAAVSATSPEAPGKAAQGKLKFVDNTVDATTGTVKVKAVFDNRNNTLWPGAFVNVAMTARVIQGATIVPQASIIQSARGPIVYAVQDGKAVMRPVQQLVAQGDDAAVSGVKPGERIVLDGRQNMRPGAAVVERGAGRAGGAAPGAASGAASGSASGPASGPASGSASGSGRSAGPGAAMEASSGAAGNITRAPAP